MQNHSFRSLDAALEQALVVPPGAPEVICVTAEKVEGAKFKKPMSLRYAGARFFLETNHGYFQPVPT